MATSISQSLPTEIIIRILHRLHSEHKWRRDPSPNLLAYCLISKAWSRPAQVLLFRCVTEPRCLPFYHSIITKPKLTIHTLLCNVRILEVPLIMELADPPLTGPIGLTQKQLRALIPNCPQLYELKLIIRGVFDLDISFQCFLSVHSSAIKSLHLVGCSVESPILYSLLEGMPSVEFLTLGCEISTPPPIAVPRHQLYELALYRNIGHQQLQWLLDSSIDTLRILELRDLPGLETIRVLTPYCPNIHSLRLINFNAKCANLVSHCTQLQELSLWNLPTVFPIKELPHSLEHFSFVQYSHITTVLDLLPIIKESRILPNLKIITCGKMIQQDESFSKLRDTCEERHVDLCPDLLTYWPAVYPVKTRRFPRGRSPSMFYFMHGDMN